MARISELPIELLLDIITHLPLKSLIACMALNHLWRDHLVPAARIDLYRKQYLDLYYDAVHSRDFLLACEKVEPPIEFNRTEWLGAFEELLVKSGGAMPKDFAMYIDEWPAKAILARNWPGVQTVRWPPNSKTNRGIRPHGTCSIPSVCRIRESQHKLPTVGYFTDNGKAPKIEERVTVLPVWSIGMNHHWMMVVDRNEVIQKDGLFGTMHVVHDCVWNIYDATGRDPGPKTWIDYLRKQASLAETKKIGDTV
jgi:hypothetical protein